MLFIAGAGLIGVTLLYSTYPASLSYREPYAGNADVTGAFALFYVKKLSSPYFLGRAPGSTGGDRAARYLAEQFRRLGLKPGGEGETYFQSVAGRRFELVKEGKRWKPVPTGSNALFSDNVLGYLGSDGLEPVKKVIMISAHYDHLGSLGKDFFPGANDNASGVAVLLEAARILKSEPLPAGSRIVFAAWTFEEEGMLGSSGYAASYPLNKVCAVINLDALGNGNSREFLVWTHKADDPLVKVLSGAAQELGIELDIQELPVSSPHTSDHLPFFRRGVSAVTITSPDWLEGNHTFQDTAEKINEERLRMATVLVIKAVERLAC